MKNVQEQEKEILTIEEVNLGLCLSHKDVEKLWKKAGSVGLTAPELISSFIGDLVNGTYTNGSDERRLAQQWFSRCGFEMGFRKTFLRYVLNFDDVDTVIGLWDDIIIIREELEYAESHKDEITGEETDIWKKDLADLEEEINEIFSRYKEWAKGEFIGTLEEQMGFIMKWQLEMIDCMKRG